MKKASKAICLLLSVGIFLMSLAGCSAPATEITLTDLHLETAQDYSIPQLSGDKSTEMLSNIDRGFRLETYYTLGSGRAWPADENSDGYEMLEEELTFYEADCAREIQVYIYLTEYFDKPLDALALEQLKAYFETVRNLRLHMLLRFAYDYEQPSDVSPAPDVMLGHIAQLKTFITENETLIRDTVTAYQFGMIGAWGEWGSTAQKYNERKVLDAIIDMFPDGTYFQGRYTRVVKQTQKNELSDFVGYHNDFLVGRPHPWNTAGDQYGSRDYKTFFANAPYRLNDGEMPWGGHSDEPDEVINGINFLRQMREHSMDTLSIKHNYIENKSGTEGSEHNLYRWKSEFITADILQENQLPYYEGWFKNADGETVSRSIYEYLRDYLGYLLMLSNLEITNTDAGTQIAFTVTNYGLGTPLTLDKFELVLCDQQTGETEVYPLQGVDVKQLITYGQLHLSTVVDSAENKDIGIRIARTCSTGDYTVKTANDVPYINGVNYVA